MSHKASLGVAVLLVLLSLAGCGSFFTSKDSISGSEIYTVNSTQDATSPWIIHITVDVNTEARNALAATAGYKTPDKVHIWMAATSDYSSSLFSTIEMRPLATINVTSGFTTIAADVNLLELASGKSSGLRWLDSYDFSPYGSLKMTGYYLLASDGWSNPSDTSKSYSLSGESNHTFSFPENLPAGQGISTVAPLTATFINIINPLGWHSNPENVSSIALGSTVTLTYGSDSPTDNPYLYYYGGSAWGYIYAPTTPTAPSANGKYVWTFKLEFTPYGSPETTVTTDGNTLYIPIDGSFFLYSENTSDYYSNSFTVY